MNTIYIVEPEPMTRQGLALTFEAEPDLTVCGEAADGEAALRAVRQLAPDLVTVEITLPGMSGLDLMQRILARRASTRILATAAQDEAICAERALRAGAHGFLVRHEPIETILHSVRAVLAGHYYVSDLVSDELLGMIARSAMPLILLPIDVLSDRELELFEWTGRGLNTHEIAERMHVSAATIESYRNRTKDKLNLRSTTDLLRQAIQWVNGNRLCYSPRGCVPAEPKAKTYSGG